MKVLIENKPNEDLITLIPENEEDEWNLSMLGGGVYKEGLMGQVVGTGNIMMAFKK